MIRVALNEVKDDLSRYLRLAEKEDVIITRHGMPAGMLIGFEDPDDWWEELLLRNPRFQARIEQARQNIQAGKGITLEELREKHDIPTQSGNEENLNTNGGSQTPDQPEPTRRRKGRKQSKPLKASGASQ
jgi:prevent-host-death family protein